MPSKAEALYGRKKQKADKEAQSADFASSDTGADSYNESEDVISAANSTLTKGRALQSEVERQQFMKMNDEEKKKFLQSKGK